MTTYFVYILTNASRTTLYVGYTSELLKRIWQHKNGVFDGFTSKYKVNRLVYLERHMRVWNAIAREKEIKGWRRAKKVALIESVNPKWDDLSRHWGDRYKPTKP